MGAIMTSKQVTDFNTIVDITFDRLEADLTNLEKLDINKETRSYKKDKREYKKEMLKVYEIIHAQCTDDMIQELQTYSPYESFSNASDSV